MQQNLYWCCYGIFGEDRIEGARFLHDGRYKQDTNTSKNAPSAQEGLQYVQKPQHLLSTYFKPFAKRDQKRHAPVLKLFIVWETILLSMGCIQRACLIKHFCRSCWFQLIFSFPFLCPPVITETTYLLLYPQSFTNYGVPIYSVIAVLLLNTWITRAQKRLYSTLTHKYVQPMWVTDIRDSF